MAESPLFKPFEPKPYFDTISFVTAKVDGLSLICFRLDCRFTLTTSKGLTNIASVTPAKKPAHENVYNNMKLYMSYEQLGDSAYQ